MIDYDRIKCLQDCATEGQMGIAETFFVYIYFFFRKKKSSLSLSLSTGNDWSEQNKNDNFQSIVETYVSFL
jgi:hypothetical protein